MEDLELIILEFIHNKTGYANPKEPYSNWEELEITEIKTQNDEAINVVFKYFFDEDSFSQYDKGHKLEGTMRFGKNKEILSWSLKEFHTGVAANLKAYESKK